MYKEKISKKKLPKIGFNRVGHRSHIKGFGRMIANKSFRRKIESVLHKQCKRLERELVKGVSK